MSKTAVAKAQEPAPLPVATSDTAAIIAALTRAARDPETDIQKMQWLMEARVKLIAEKSEEDFEDAMAAAQAEMTPIRADAENPSTRSKYASLAQLDRALRPIYTRHGFSLSFNTGEAPEDHVRVLCYVSCKGHKRTYELVMPADGKGARGGDVMTRTHATGSAVSYGMRYLLKMIFNIAVGEADDDGNRAARMREMAQATPKPGDPNMKRITATEVKKLRQVMKLADVEDGIILEHFKVGALEELNQAQYKTALSKCNRKMITLQSSSSR